MGWDGMDWIHLALDMVMNFHVALHTVKLPSSEMTVGLTRRHQLHGGQMADSLYILKSTNADRKVKAAIQHSS
jgi:hypothetical protein